MKKLYYIPYVTREGGWIRTNGYLISDNLLLLKQRQEKMPVDESDNNPYSREINSIDITNHQMDMFLTKSVDSILWGDEFELENYK